MVPILPFFLLVAMHLLFKSEKTEHSHPHGHKLLSKIQKIKLPKVDNRGPKK